MTLEESCEKILEDKKIFGTVTVATDLIRLESGSLRAFHPIGTLKATAGSIATVSGRREIHPQRGSPRIPPRFRRGSQ